MIKESEPPTMGHLEKGNFMHYNHTPFLEDNNTTKPLQKGDRWSVWFTSEEISSMNSSVNLLNVYNINLYIEGNASDIISITVI